MKPRFVPALFLLVLTCVAMVGASDGQASPQSSAPPPHMSKQTRMDMIRAFTAELVYIRTSFPMGKKGLTLKNGVVSPSGEELQRMVAMWGPAVKAGDQARLTAIAIKDDRIHFEINGGPVKKTRWYQHIQVGVGGNQGSASPTDQNANPRGSYVDLVFDHYVPDLSPQELKNLLRPVFDFDAQSAVEAYLDTVPPKVKEAIKNHQVLVGMNHDMVLYAKGHAPKKVREKDGNTEYEDWIYGEPPQDVDFVRFVGDEVVRVETMKVSGEKVVRTEKEVDLTPQPSVAKASQEPRPANAPTLRRPGEEGPNTPRVEIPSPTVPNTGSPDPTPTPSPGPHMVMNYDSAFESSSCLS